MNLGTRAKWEEPRAKFEKFQTLLEVLYPLEKFPGTTLAEVEPEAFDRQGNLERSLKKFQTSLEVLHLLEKFSSTTLVEVEPKLFRRQCTSREVEEFSSFFRGFEAFEIIPGVNLGRGRTRGFSQWFRNLERSLKFFKLRSNFKLRSRYVVCKISKAQLRPRCIPRNKT